MYFEKKIFSTLYKMRIKFSLVLTVVLFVYVCVFELDGCRNQDVAADPKQKPDTDTTVQNKSLTPPIPRPLEMMAENLRRIDGWLKASTAKKPPEFKGWAPSIIDRETVRYVRYTLLTETPPQEVERLPVGAGTSWYFVGEIVFDGLTKDKLEVQVKVSELNTKFKKDSDSDSWVPIQEEEFEKIIVSLGSLRFLPVADNKYGGVSKYFLDIPIDE